MFGLLMFLFVILFLVILAVVRIGLQFQEGQKKKKVTEMLSTASGDAVQMQTKVLLEPDKAAKVAMAKFLSQFNFARKLELEIQQAGLTMSVYTLLMMMVILLVPGALLGARFNILMFRWLSILSGALLFFFLPLLYVRRTQKKRMNAFEDQFPEALDFLARAMRAGHAFSISLEMLSEESPQPLGQEFRKVFNEQNLGLPIETALQNLAMRVPLLDVSFFVSAVLLQRETGGNLSEILTNLAHIIRERFKLKGAVKAASAHGRITGSILTLMPVALMLGLLMVAPGYLQGMAADPDGRKMIAGAIIGILLGHFTIKRIVSIKV